MIPQLIKLVASSLANLAGASPGATKFIETLASGVGQGIVEFASSNDVDAAIFKTIEGLQNEKAKRKFEDFHE